MKPTGGCIGEIQQRTTAQKETAWKCEDFFSLE